jgi:putative ABC transport system substrate-binding protein
MRRREFFTVLSGAAAWPLAARAQQVDHVRSVGVLMGYAESDPAAQSWFAAFRTALGKLGWTEGSNLRIEVRWAASNTEKIGTFAKEIVDLRPHTVLGTTTPVIAALARETRTIPIVFAGVADPIGSGFSGNLAHPSGNITGFTDNDPVMGSKWLELLKEVSPKTQRVALLFNPATSVPLQFFMPAIQAAASSFAVQVSATPVHARDEIEGIIAAQAQSAGSGLVILPDVFNVTNRDLIITLAARYAIPAVYNNPVYAESGGLIAVGTNRVEVYRQAAGYVDRILKGDKPGELPIQLPTSFELAINLKTAKTLGLTIPDKLLATADEVIE